MTHCQANYATNSKARKSIAIGDQVTCLVPVEAYSSNNGFMPEQWFRPGMVGTVATTDTPCIYLVPCSQNCTKGHQAFYCVDFRGVEHGKNSGKWRVALNACNIRKV